MRPHRVADRLFYCFLSFSFFFFIMAIIIGDEYQFFFCFPVLDCDYYIVLVVNDL